MRGLKDLYPRHFRSGPVFPADRINKGCQRKIKGVNQYRQIPLSTQTLRGRLCQLVRAREFAEQE